MSSVTHAKPKPTATSALRSARAEAVARQLREDGGKPTYLGDLYARMRFRGLSHAQVDKALDDLAEARRVTITTSQYGGLVVQLRGAR